MLAWLALLQCGARVLPLNPQLPGPLLAELLPTLDLRHALVLNGGDLPVTLNPLTLYPVNGERAADWREDRMASMTLTSGSTGLPKAAVHAFRAHIASAEGVLALIPFAPQDDWLLSLPLFHVSGEGDSLALAGCRRRPDGARQTAAGAGATRLYSRLPGANPALAAAERR